ncbi:MAG: hypothetical protein VW932_05820 [Flavobacteriaceae bacterium]
MKKYIYLILATILPLSINAQINLESFSGSATEGAVFAQMRKTRSYGNDLPTVGSPYVNENFTEGEVFYNEKSLGVYLYRHNAFNDEVEVVKPGDESVKYIKDEQGNFVPAEGESSSLATIKEIVLKDKETGRSLSLTTITNEDGALRNAYLYELASGQNYTLYYQNRVGFKEGVRAVNSMVRTTPNRFTHFQDFYIRKNNEEIAYFFSGKKKDLSTVLKKEDLESAEAVIGSQKLKTKTEEDLIILIEELNRN